MMKNHVAGVHPQDTQLVTKKLVISHVESTLSSKIGNQTANCKTIKMLEKHYSSKKISVGGRQIMTQNERLRG